MTARRAAFAALALLAARVATAADCATAPLRKTGKIYYYCACEQGAARGCVGGDDRNPGTSPGAPRRTLEDAAAQFAQMDAGDTVALCRGGVWKGGMGLANPRCSARSETTWCELRDYAPRWATPKTPRPRIEAGAGNGLMLWNSSADFQGYRIWNLAIHNDTRSYDGPRSIFIANRQQHVDICNVHTEGAFIGLETTSKTRDITVRSSSFVRHGWDAMYVESPGLIVDSNVFLDNGDQNVDPKRAGQAHTIYVACNDPAIPCAGVRITNNEVRTGPDGAWGQCRGHMVILRGYLPGLLLENNLVAGSGVYGCGAISLSGSWARTEIHGARILRNRVQWGAGSTIAVQVDACQGCTIADNVIVHGGGPQSIGIIHPEHASTEPGSTAAPTTGTTIQNNTFHMVNGGIALQVAKEGEGFVIENNAAWTEGDSCFDVRRPTLRSAHNFCRAKGGPPASSLWRDPAQGDYRAARRGPLARAGSPTSFSPFAIGAVRWSPSDAGERRVAPVDVGAFHAKW